MKKWEHGTYLHGGCEICHGKTTHRLFERDATSRGDDEMLLSACDKHFELIKRMEELGQDNWNEDMERNEELMNDNKEELKELESK